jgi:hypothetical protein
MSLEQEEHTEKQELENPDIKLTKGDQSIAIDLDLLEWVVVGFLVLIVSLSLSQIGVI